MGLEVMLDGAELTEMHWGNNDFDRQAKLLWVTILGGMPSHIRQVMSVWDPYVVLNLDPEVRNTCVGRAHSDDNAPCRLPVCLADRKLACNALDAMARSRSNITPKSLERVASLLLCKRYHQYQISEVVEDWTERINHAQDLDQDTKRWVSQINQLQDQLEKAEIQAKEDRQESKTVEELLSQLAQLDQEAEKLRKQLSKARKTEDEALQAKAGAEQVSRDLSTQLDGWKRSARKSANRALRLLSEKEILEDKLSSRERDLTDVKKIEEKLTEELACVRDQLGEMLYNPPPGEPWWAINCELSFESTYDITAKVRKSFAAMQSTVEAAQQHLFIKETDNSTLQHTLASAQAETETAKKRLSAKETAYTALQQHHLASAHTRNQQLALAEETISHTRRELGSLQQVVGITTQQLPHEIRVYLQDEVDASSTIKEIGEVIRVLYRKGEEAERRIAAADELFSALRLGGIRVLVWVVLVGALQVYGRR